MQILLFMQLQTNRLKLSALKASAFVPLSNGGRVTVRYRSAFIFTFFEIISNLESDYHIFILMRIRYSCSKTLFYTYSHFDILGHKINRMVSIKYSPVITLKFHSTTQMISETISYVSNVCDVFLVLESFHGRVEMC